MAEIKTDRYQIALVLIVIIVVIYICIAAVNAFSNQKKKICFPPWLTSCPDYWKDKGNGLCEQVVDDNSERNGKVGGTKYEATTDFSDPVADLSNMTLVDKCAWSKENHIHWDGVSDRSCNVKSFACYNQ